MSNESNDNTDSDEDGSQSEAISLPHDDTEQTMKNNPESKMIADEDEDKIKKTKAEEAAVKKKKQNDYFDNQHRILRQDNNERDLAVNPKPEKPATPGKRGGDGGMGDI